MEPIELREQAFIIRIWLEEIAVEAGSAKWRGQITHIPSSQRRYFEELDAINHFIVPYLRELGVEVNT